MVKRIILITAAFLAVKICGAESLSVSKESDAVSRTNQKSAEQKTAEQEKAERIAALDQQRTELVLKIHKKRQELLKSNPKLRKMHQQLLKQTRELALELDSNIQMRRLNNSLRDVERQLEKEQAPVKTGKTDQDQKK